MFHAEMNPDEKEQLNHNQLNYTNTEEYKHDPTSYKHYLDSRVDAYETTAINEVISLSKANPTVPVHIVHLSTQFAIKSIYEAKFLKNLPITVETCFHYLSLNSESIPDKATYFKCCPPIRSKSNQNELWNALKSNIITTVVSDHSPCTPNLKKLKDGDFSKAWGGISGVGYGLSILWTEIKKRNDNSITISDLSKWLSFNTAKQTGLLHSKGSIKIGKCADFLIFDPNEKWIVKNDESYFKNKLTAYNDKELIGRVLETIVGGHGTFVINEGHSKLPFGKLILEKRFN